jgi:hypothetical protein
VAEDENTGGGDTEDENTGGGDANLDEGQDVGPVLLLLRMIAKKR